MRDGPLCHITRERIPVETKQYPDMECDVVIAGCGVAGLYAALNLPTSTRVIMLSKGAVDECDSMLAQGGICVLPEGSDYDAFFEDTMHAGHYENRRESVDIMIRSSRSVINDLLAMGVDFERKTDGSLDFTREGAHSRPRIAFHADITGKEITTKLLQAVRKLDNVQILEHVAMTDILTASVTAPRCAPVSSPFPWTRTTRFVPPTSWQTPPRTCMSASRLRSMPATRCGRRAVSAACTTIRPTTRSSRAMPATSLRSMALRWSTWTTCRFTPRVCSRRSRAAPS